MCRALAVANPENGSLEDIQAAVVAAVSPRSRTRLQAIKALILGIAREQVQLLFDVAERTLREWIEAWNTQGIDGLVERRHPGRPPIIAQEQAQFLVGFLEEPQKAGQSHWTAVKFHGFVQEKLGVEMSYSTVLRFIHEEGFRLKVPQPCPDRADPQQRQVFCELLARLAGDDGVELWFSDETGVEGDPRPRRRWAKVGEKARVVKNGDHVRMNVCGMVCPRTGEAFLLEFSHSDTEVFQAFLDEANREIAPGRPRQILVVDNASWHKSASLHWGRFEPLFLPSYSPDLNPIERLWQVIKREWFTDHVCPDRDALVQRLDKALTWAMQRGEANKKTCAIRREI